MINTKYIVCPHCGSIALYGYKNRPTMYKCTNLHCHKDGFINPSQVTYATTTMLEAFLQANT